MAISHRPENFNRSDRIVGNGGGSRSNSREENFERDREVINRWAYKRNHFIDGKTANYTRRPSHFSDKVEKNSSVARRMAYRGSRRDSIAQTVGYRDRPMFLKIERKRTNASYERHRGLTKFSRRGWRDSRTR